MRSPPADCIAAAQAADRRWGVFASVSLAQWALESAWGSRPTGRFNPFGIKAGAGQPATLCWTHEEVHGRLIACQQRFRDFPGITEAFDAHARLIATDRRYAPAMAAKASLPAFIRALAPLYATDHGYEAKLLELIREEAFGRYDPKAPGA